MTPSELTALIVASFAGVTTLITALGVVYNIYLTNKQGKETKQKLEENTAITHDLRISIDGRMEQLLDQKGKASAAEGELKGRADVHAEVKAERQEDVIPAIIPLPTTDKKTTAAVDRVVDAIKNKRK